MQIGQNGTEQSGMGAAGGGAARTPRPVVRLPRDPVGLAWAMIAPSLSRPRSCGGPRVAGEPDLQPVLDEAGLLYLQTLEGLWKHEVALVGSHPEEQLLALAKHLQLALLRERQAQAEHIGGPQLADPHGLVEVEDLGCVPVPVHLGTHL